MNKKQCMTKILNKIGRDKAIELVVHAYNTELVTNWLRHIEAGNTGKLASPERRDHLGEALGRIVEVCDLTD